MNWPISNEKHLCAVLGISRSQLYHLAEHAFEYYYSFTKTEIKKDGTIKTREITPSERLLKAIQQKINTKILQQIPVPDYIYGSTKGKSSIANSKIHKGKKFHFCLDISNFFPSISNSRVNQTLLDLRFHPVIASLLTKMMTYQGHVPQGAPTSSAIANLVLYFAIDLKLEPIFKAHGITYSRYIDDLNFSSQSDFQDTVPDIISVVVNSCFKINKKKTFYKAGNVVMTGALVGNNVLKVTEKHKLKLADPLLKESSRIGLENYIKQLKTF